MIVCSCNVLSDHDVRAAVSAASDTPRTAKQVYGCLGCSPECGRCARTIKQIMTEALTGAALAGAAPIALTDALAGDAETAGPCCAHCACGRAAPAHNPPVRAVAPALDSDPPVALTA